MDCQVAPEPKPSDRAARAALTVELEYRRGNHRFRPRTYRAHGRAPRGYARVWSVIFGTQPSRVNPPLP